MTVVTKGAKARAPTELAPDDPLNAKIADEVPQTLAEAWECWSREYEDAMRSSGVPTNEDALVVAGRQLYKQLLSRTMQRCAVIPGEVADYVVELDADPTTVGIASLMERLRSVQAYKDRITALLTTTIARMLRDWERFQFEAEAVATRIADCELVSARMKAAGLGNKEQRAAQVNQWHPGIVELKVYIEDGLRQAQWLVELLRERLKNLESTNSNVSRQITVVQLLLETGELRRVFPNET